MKRIKHGFKLVVCLCFFTGCAPLMPDFHEIIEYHEYEGKLEDKNFAKYIIIEETFSTSLKLAIRDLHAYRPEPIQKYAAQLTLPQENHLFKGLYYFKERDYSTAKLHFQLAYEADRNFIQAKLLMLDCALELKDEKDYYSAYQDLLNSCTDVLICDLIKIRYQYVRHHLY